MMRSYSIETTIGKHRKETSGVIGVDTPDFSGDMRLFLHPVSCGEEVGIYLRPVEARMLARVLLQASEGEGETE